ncbi:MAG: hypothetical protein QM723_11525 [Myxococcaceae bacterium]
MRFLTPFRLAAYLLLLFCAGHTAGGMLAQKSLGADSDVVFAQMKTVHFVFNGADSTWYGFWMGFGLTVSAFLLLVALAAWQLDAVSAQAWPSVSVIAWGLVAAMAFNGVMAVKFFFLGPTVFSALITGLLVTGIVRKSRAVRSATPGGASPAPSLPA